MTRMTRKVLNVMEEKWDYLIILDACRYDYFESLYKEFFDGDLEKRISLGSNTIEWCLESFKGYYPDVIYISGNPYINSKVGIKGFNARRNFYKVIDVWDFGWDNELSTVPPWNINKYALKYIDKKMIIHYMQPHGPYIGKVRLDIETWDKYGKTIRGMWEHPRPDINLLREAYKANLELVLREVERLIKYVKSRGFKKKIVITADHGELLGEDGMFAHPCHVKHPVLNTVPWLEVQL